MPCFTAPPLDKLHAKLALHRFLSIWTARRPKRMRFSALVAGFFAGRRRPLLGGTSKSSSHFSPSSTTSLVAWLFQRPPSSPRRSATSTRSTMKLEPPAREPYESPPYPRANLFLSRTPWTMLRHNSETASCLSIYFFLYDYVEL